MTIKIVLASVFALGAAALAGPASAMPIAPMGQATVANVEKVAVACGRHGCIRTRPVYRGGGAVVVRRPYVHRYYHRRVY